ncbi:hypothetical protein EVAR_84203_1 [Eumeta japonica]|uniref:Uncharacterized protein n=1 Tax=Eumeta variegata TaxID=151549 RepID=A0A4C1S7Q5_EUMVA|nr:hypothetical protein EVAR_84203_1 [Eumeta japonica]
MSPAPDMWWSWSGKSEEGRGTRGCGEKVAPLRKCWGCASRRRWRRSVKARPAPRIMNYAEAAAKPEEAAAAAKTPAPQDWYRTHLIVSI